MNDTNNSPGSDVEAGEAQYIVECPACHTRYGVDSYPLNELDQPQFHCSRCDQVFFMEANELNSPNLAASGKMQDDKSAKVDGDVKEAFSADLSSQDKKPKSEATKLSQPEQIGLNLEDQLQGTGDKNGLAGIDLSDTQSHPTFPEAEQFISRSNEHDKAKEEASSVPFTTYEDLKEPEEEISTAKEAIFNDPTEDLTSAEQTEILDQIVANQSSDPKAPRALSGKSAILLFVLPVIFSLIVLIAFGILIKSDAKLYATLSEKYLPSSLQLAPAGLRIKESSFSRIKLLNGDVVHVIAGKVTNNTKESFSKIYLEGVVFDSSGAAIASEKVLVPALSKRISKDKNYAEAIKEELSSLSIDMIKNYQASGVSKRFRLRPGAEVPFALALFSDDVDKARFYNARIYSVVESS